MTTDATLPTCVRHPDRETRLACPRCGRPACDRCLTMQDGVEACQVCRDEPVDPPNAVGEPAGTPGDQPRTAPRPRTPMRRPAQEGSPVTFTLLAIFVAIQAFALLGGDGGLRIQEAAAQINSAVEAGEWWRVLTATVLHGNTYHLLFNGYALYVLGAQLERGVGSGPFAALYVAAALAGGIAFLFSSPQQTAVGASGAIFGLFGAWFAAAWVNRDTPQGRAGLTQFGVLLLINMALPLFLPGIAWQAHVGGFLAGAVVGLGWARRGRRAPAPTPADRVLLPAAVAGVLFIGLLWYTMT